MTRRVLVDATPRGGSPGTLYLREPDLQYQDGDTLMDAHSLTPDAIFAVLRTLGGRGRGC
jgi:hydrogenase maturation protease